MSDGRLPFAHLNLRRNPFGELTAAERTSLACVEIDDVAEQLRQPGAVVQFLGEKGFGKTTHLLSIHRRFEGSAYVHIPDGQPAQIPHGNPLLIDEAQRLTNRQWKQILRAGVPLVLGTHTDYTDKLRRAGRVVSNIAVAESTDGGRLHRLVNDRIRFLTRSAGPVPVVRIETCERLLQRHGPDIRSILEELYNVFQSLTEVQDV